MSRQIYQVILNSVEIDAKKAIHPLGSPMDFYLCFLHLMSGLDEIRYLRSAHNADCREDRAQDRP